MPRKLEPPSQKVDSNTTTPRVSFALCHDIIRGDRETGERIGSGSATAPVFTGKPRVFYSFVMRNDIAKGKKMAQAIKSPMADVVHAKPVSQNDPVNQPLANKRAREGAGAALADLLCTETMKQAASMKNFVLSLTQLDSDGRKGFSDYLSSVLKERRALVKENGTKLYKAINASASVRLSEFNTLSKAMDKGYVPDMEQGYHVIVSAAREHLRAMGEGDKRGRKATHGIIKALKSLEKMEGVDDSDKAVMAALYNYAAELAIGLGLAVEKGEEATF